MNPENLQPHRRKNLLTGEWVLVSPQRAQRPWQGQQETSPPENLPAHDPNCYLCPGNVRVQGQQNPQYHDVHDFTNDFGALIESSPWSANPDSEPSRLSAHLDSESSRLSAHLDSESNRLSAHPETLERVDKQQNLFQHQPESGICKVICFSPRHDLTLAQMDTTAIRKVVDRWCELNTDLGNRPDIHHVQIFENKGLAMGCSNPHPHGQVWAQAHIPELPAKEQAQQQAHYLHHGKPLLADYLAAELQHQERLILENDHFAVVVPYWAAWPFETLVLPKRNIPNLSAMTDPERTAFADAIRRITCRYDNLFQTSFPYSAGIHQAPTNGNPHPEWTLHMHFFPPLLRSATIKKFMVGYEMLCEPQRDITPESSAARLREAAEVHYSQI